MVTLHIQLFGSFYLEINNEPITGITSPRLQALVTYLLLHDAEPQSRQQLAFVFWPDSSETAAHTNLRSVVRQLRHALPDADHFLAIDRRTIRWKPDAPFTLDVTRFGAALVRAERMQHVDEQRTALVQAIKIYT